MLLYATVAAAGSASTDAAELSCHINQVTGADGTVGVRLSGARIGREVLVYNTHATAGLKVYPHSGGDINDGSADAAVSIEGKTLGRFICLDGTTWGAIYTANT